MEGRVVEAASVSFGESPAHHRQTAQWRKGRYSGVSALFGSNRLCKKKFGAPGRVPPGFRSWSMRLAAVPHRDRRYPARAFCTFYLCNSTGARLRDWSDEFRIFSRSGSCEAVGKRAKRFALQRISFARLSLCSHACLSRSGPTSGSHVLAREATMMQVDPNISHAWRVISRTMPLRAWFSGGTNDYA